MRLATANPPPITAGEFAGLLAPLGPFEPRPEFAVAVSGGRDSMALVLLAHGWARRRRGRVTALIVDHGLRSESAAEARRVGAWLARRGIDRRVLRWPGPYPDHGVQAAARAARYDLLEAWCRRHGVLHLLLGHHRGDQAETFVLRLSRASGIDGLAGMPPIADRGGMRVLRPLLSVPRARLAASLVAAGQDWVDDASNLDIRYGRVRVRARLPALTDAGVTVPWLAATAGRLGHVRAALEAAVDRWLAAGAWLHPAGYALLDLAVLRRAPAAVGRRALARCLTTIGGSDYGPRSARLGRLHSAIVGDTLLRGRTLAGCRIVALRDRLLICREPRAVQDHVSLDHASRVNGTTRWDSRFAVRVGRTVPSGYTLGALGAGGWRQVAGSPGTADVPAAVRASLPAIWRGGTVAAVPFLRYHAGVASESIKPIRLWFAPRRALSAAHFIIVSSG